MRGNSIAFNNAQDMPQYFAVLLREAEKHKPYGLWCGPGWIAWTSPPDVEPPKMIEPKVRLT